MDPGSPTDQPPLPPPMPVMPPAAQANGLAVAALVCGILAIVLFFTIVFPFILGGLAVIFGAIGIGTANKGGPHKGLAIAGLICGVVGIGLAVAFIALFATTSVHIHTFSPSISPFG